MSALALLTSAIIDLHTSAARDNGSGAPARIPGHEADRLAAMPRTERRFRFSPRRPRFRQS